MNLEELIRTRITGIEPINELAIDEDIWREAHSRHVKHSRIHASSVHRDGIVFGLEVMPHPSDGTKVLLAPGVAIDAAGRILIVTRKEEFVLTDRGMFYIIAQYSETRDPAYKLEIEGKNFKYRLIEGCQVERTKEAPSGPVIELARIERTKSDKPVRMAVDPFDPGPDELNLLYRRKAFPYCAADGVVGECSYVPTAEKATWKPNRPGLISLITQANLQGFHVSFGGPIPPKNLKDESPLMLYMAGKSGMDAFEADKVEALKSYLDAGGTILFEPEGSGDEFHKAVQALLVKLKAKPEKTVAGDRILSSHFSFSGAPKGKNPKGTLEVDEDRGVIVSTMGYGSAWRLMGGDDPNAQRELSRSAAEFGMNILAFASQRKRLVELAKLAEE